MQQQDPASKMQEVVRAAVAKVHAGSDLMRVNDAARLIIIEYGLEPLQEAAIVDALCRECIMRGVSIEFQARESQHQLV